MFRILLTTMILIVSLRATIINFEEEKYIDVLGNSIKKNGKLEFIDNTIKLQYTNSKRVLIYENEVLNIYIEDEVKKIDLENQIALKVSFLLIESIHYDNIKDLENYFIIEKEEDVTFLKPKELLKNHIISVEYKKTKRLEYLTIFMSNGNKTTIRELDD